eukprot:scaffold91_cov127-Cylindrotheca_fusiformis.AAC.10
MMYPQLYSLFVYLVLFVVALCDGADANTAVHVNTHGLLVVTTHITMAEEASPSQWTLAVEEASIKDACHAPHDSDDIPVLYLEENLALDDWHCTNYECSANRNSTFVIPLCQDVGEQDLATRTLVVTLWKQLDESHKRPFTRRLATLPKVSQQQDISPLAKVTLMASTAATTTAAAVSRSRREQESTSRRERLSSSSLWWIVLCVLFGWREGCRGSHPRFAVVQQAQEPDSDEESSLHSQDSCCSMTEPTDSVDDQNSDQEEDDHASFHQSSPQGSTYVEEEQVLLDQHDESVVCPQQQQQQCTRNLPLCHEEGNATLVEARIARIDHHHGDDGSQENDVLQEQVQRQSPLLVNSHLTSPSHKNRQVDEHKEQSDEDGTATTSTIGATTRNRDDTEREGTDTCDNQSVELDTIIDHRSDGAISNQQEVELKSIKENIPPGPCYPAYPTTNESSSNYSTRNENDPLEPSRDLQKRAELVAGSKANLGGIELRLTQLPLTQKSTPGKARGDDERLTSSFDLEPSTRQKLAEAKVAIAENNFQLTQPSCSQQNVQEDVSKNKDVESHYCIQTNANNDENGAIDLASLISPPRRRTSEILTQLSDGPSNPTYPLPSQNILATFPSLSKSRNVNRRPYMPPRLSLLTANKDDMSCSESYVSTLPPDSDYCSAADEAMSPHESLSQIDATQGPQHDAAPVLPKPRPKMQKLLGRKRYRGPVDEGEILEIGVIPTSIKRPRPFRNSNIVPDWVPSNRLQTASKEFAGGEGDAWDAPALTTAAVSGSKNRAKRKSLGIQKNRK